MIRHRSLIAVALLPLLLLAGVVLVPASRTQGQDAQTDAPLTDEQIQALAARTLKNQHQNDLLLAQYDRTEHEQVRGNGMGVNNKETLARVVPTGTSEARVELQRDGMPTDPALLEKQWRDVTNILLVNSRTDDPDVKKEYERAAKRDHERAEIVDTVAKAFRFHYMGRETVGGKKLLELSFDPDPGFHSSIRYASVCAHIHGEVWVDESNAQIVKLEAELFDDYSVAAGLVGKVYHGSSVTLEQTEIEPGVWMPTRTSYYLEGRKFLFAVTMHETMEESDYRRVGPPREALQVISRERAEQSLENVKNQR